MIGKRVENLLLPKSGDVATCGFPEMARISLDFDSPVIADVAEHMEAQLAVHSSLIQSGARIGIAVGSRGIHRMGDMIRAIVEFIKVNGASPVIVPAMGSHGGASSQGQTDVLAEYGISEEEIGIPVMSSMDIVCAGHVQGNIPVYFDKIAAGLDGIILFNRIKPHSDFRGPYESGLMKQIAIGLGNHKGAQNIHTHGVHNLSTLIPESALLILESMPILMGVAVIENSKGQAGMIEVLIAEEIPRLEPGLLDKAKELMPYLPFRNIDLLVVEELGKNISGVGIDPNLTGRVSFRHYPRWGNVQIQRIVCLDLTPETQGNAQGIGLADFIPRRAFEKIDFNVTYVNVLTNGALELAFVPIVLESDKAVMSAALHRCERDVTPQDARIVQIRNTLQLESMNVSLPLLDQIEESLSWDREEVFSYRFSPDGELQNLLGRRRSK